MIKVITIFVLKYAEQLLQAPSIDDGIARYLIKIAYKKCSFSKILQNLYGEESKMVDDMIIERT